MGYSIKKPTGAYGNFCYKFHMEINHSKSKIMTFSTQGQQMYPIQIGSATYANGQQKYLGFVCEPGLKRDGTCTAK